MTPIAFSHLHTTSGVAVAAQRDGVLPISQQSIVVLSSLAYHDYEGLALNDDERPRLAADLGNKHFLMLHNHGLLTAGETVADAFLYMYLFERTCSIQVAAQAGGSPLIPISDAIVGNAEAQLKAVTKGALGSLPWPALLRKLDRLDPSYRS